MLGPIGPIHVSAHSPQTREDLGRVLPRLCLEKSGVPEKGGAQKESLIIRKGVPRARGVLGPVEGLRKGFRSPRLGEERANVKDGLYRIKYKGICAGFVLHKGRVVRAAPVLRRRMHFWASIAEWVGL